MIVGDRVRIKSAFSYTKWREFWWVPKDFDSRMGKGLMCSVADQGLARLGGRGTTSEGESQNWQIARHTPNENKMSDGGRRRVLLGVEKQKSSQK